MPDKYVMNSYIRNVNHPWFNDIKSDFKQLRWSPNKVLLCILCIIVMNIDETTFFDTDTSTNNREKSDHESNGNDVNESNEMTLYHGNALSAMNNHKSHYKQCREIPMIDYFGSESYSMYHNQILIGVMFGFIMRNRIPVLFSFINIVIRSGGSFRPKSIPMFIDRMVIRPKTNYGSSYNLLDDKSYYCVENDLNYYEDDDISSSESGEEEDADVEEYGWNELPRELFQEHLN